jgi:hypothetical protein
MAWSWWEKKKAEARELVLGWPGWSWSRRADKIENLVDDPVDDVKHKLHGIKLFGRKWYLPAWLMTSKKRSGQ